MFSGPPALPCRLPARPFADPQGPRWYAAAAAMRTLAESWGDQSYGAVLVKDDRIIGHGPSRVLHHRDPDAHAEREALRDAIARYGPDAVAHARWWRHSWTRHALGGSLF